MSVRAELFRPRIRCQLLTCPAPQYAWNPDHRHDEAHEKAEDEARLQIRKEHRFESFAGETDGNNVKWSVPESGVLLQDRASSPLTSPKVHLGARLLLRALGNLRERERNDLDTRLVAHA